MAPTDIDFDASASVIRVGLRFYFSVVLTLIGLIGGQCSILSVKKSLSRKGQVPVLRTLGWLSPFDIARAVWMGRSLTLGWMTLAMLLTSLLMVASDFAVSGLVVGVSLETRCPFDTAIPYIIFAADPGVSAYSVPQYTGYTYNMALGAQTTSVANGGTDAIYNKFNTSPNFKPQAADILGQWDCQDMGKDQSYAPGMNPNDIVADLQSQGILYATTESCWRVYGSGAQSQTNQVAIWSANNDGPIPSSPFDIRASFDTSAASGADKIMKTFHCTLDAPSARFVLEHVQVSPTLADWCETLKSTLYIGVMAQARNFTLTPAAAISSSLNTLTMNIGAVQSENVSLITDWSQGCLVARTLVPVAVTAMFAFVTLGLCAMFGYWIFLYSSQGIAAATDCIQAAPVGLFNWVMFAGRQAHAIDASPSTTTLSDLKPLALAVGRESRLFWIQSAAEDA